MIDIDEQDIMIEYYIKNYKSESKLIKKIENKILELDSNILVSILGNCDLNIETRKLFLSKITTKKCDNTTIMKVINYIDDFSKFKLGTLMQENILVILIHLTRIGDYDSAFNIIAYNNLDEEYIKIVIDLAFKYIDLSNDILNSEKVSKNLYSKDVESLYSLYESLVYFNIKESYEFDITTYINMIKNTLLGTNDIPYIIKTDIYLDNSILDLLFKDKTKLLYFLILNDYPDDYIQKVKEMYNFEEEKNNLNNETEEILVKNINMQKEKTLDLSSKGKN